MCKAIELELFHNMYLCIFFFKPDHIFACIPSLENDYEMLCVQYSYKVFFSKMIFTIKYTKCEYNKRFLLSKMTSSM